MAAIGRKDKQTIQELDNHMRGIFVLFLGFKLRLLRVGAVEKQTEHPYVFWEWGLIWFQGV